MSYLIRIASKISTQNHVKQLHAQIILKSLHQDNYWVSLLIARCTRFNSPSSYTRLILESTAHPNIFVYTSMLKYYSQAGAHHEVLLLFHKMQKRGIKPDAFVYPILVKSAGKSGVVLHCVVLKLGYAGDQIAQNAVMGMYANYGPIEVARKMFDEMPERAVADWNSMISGCWKWGLVEEARVLFEMMSEKNVVSWTAMVTGYSKIKDLEKAKWYFHNMPEKTVVSWNAMLSGYSQNGYEEDALNLFDEMINGGVRPDQTTWVTVISGCSERGDPILAERLVGMINEKKTDLNCFVQTALLDMFAKCGNLETARKIFNGLGAGRNSVTWNAMISGYARSGDLTSARELFDRMPQRNIISWNSMIAGYAQNGQSAQAVELFKEMIKSNECTPDEVTMVSVLSACGHLGALELGHWAVNFLNEAKIELSVTGYNALIFMYSKCGNMKGAMKIFYEMPQKDVVSYNALMNGLAAHGKGVEALKLVSDMKEEAIMPDRLTFMGVLTACSHAGLVEEARKVFKSIKHPSVDHYACMVDLLGRVGKLDEAVSLIEIMPMEPHAGVYGSLLNSSRIHKRVEVGEHAASKLFALEPNNCGNYILLSNVYAVAGRWKDVERVRQTMREKGVKKAAGWSWVEYGGQMHRFLAGDRSHEQSEDIYRVLSELRKKMRLSGYMADKTCVLTDVEEEEKEELVGIHSEKLAIAFGLLVSEVGSVIRVVKNLRICSDCHTAIKLISKLEEREIIVRDNNRFHCFKDGQCSCNDYW